MRTLTEINFSKNKNFASTWMLARKKIERSTIANTAKHYKDFKTTRSLRHILLYTIDFSHSKDFLRFLFVPCYL